MVNGPKEQRHSAAITIGTDKAQHQLIAAFLGTPDSRGDRVYMPAFLEYILPFPGGRCIAFQDLLNSSLPRTLRRQLATNSGCRRINQ